MNYFTGTNIGAIVIDNGSNTIKAGYAGDDCPSYIFPSSCGLSLHTLDTNNNLDHTNTIAGITELTHIDSIFKTNSNTTKPTIDQVKQRLICGDTQKLYKPGVEIISPIQHGLIMDWDTIETVWDYTFTSKLGIDPSEHPILMSEPIYNTKARREKTIELMFETFNTPATYLAKDAVLTAMASGKSNALVVTVGAGSTTVVPVCEGFALHVPSRKTKIGGDSLDAFVQNSIFSPRGLTHPPLQLYFERLPLPNGEILLRRRTELYTSKTSPPPSESFIGMLEHDLIRDIKHSTCRVLDLPFNPDTFGTVTTTEYELPDGQILRLGVEPYIIGEAFFNSDLGLGNEIEVDFTSGYKFAGLQDLVLSSVDATDVDLRKNLLQNIVLGGGTTALRGFSQRLHREINALLPVGVKSKIIYNTLSMENKYSTWLGGAILGSLSTFYPLWFTREEYEEHGASLVLRKCP